MRIAKEILKAALFGLGVVILIASIEVGRGQIQIGHVTMDVHNHAVTSLAYTVAPETTTRLADRGFAAAADKWCANNDLDLIWRSKPVFDSEGRATLWVVAVRKS